VNTQRFLEVVELLRTELNTHRVLDGLSRLKTALQTDPSRAERLKEEILSTLAQAPSNLFSPSSRLIVRSMKAHSLLGIGAGQRLQALLTDYRLNPREAGSLVGELASEILQLEGYLNNFSSSARQLGMEPHRVKAGHCEIGILYPFPDVVADLPSLRLEVDELNKHLRYLLEAGGMHGDPRLVEVSTNDLAIFLLATASAGAAVATAIERTLALIQRRLEIQRLRLEIEQREIDLEAAKLLREREEAVTDEGTREAVTVVMARAEIQDEGRRNELEIAIGHSIRFLLQNSERGVIFEVTSSQHTSDGTEVNEAVRSEGPRQREAQDLILAKRDGAAQRTFAERREQLLLPRSIQAEKV